MKLLKAIVIRLGYLVLGAMLVQRCSSKEVVEPVVVEVVKEVIVHEHHVEYVEVACKKLDRREEFNSPVLISNPDNKEEQRKNTLTLLGGVGPVGNDVSGSFTDIHVGLNYGMVAGIAYTRELTPEISGTASVLSNNTFLLGLGVKW